MDEGEFQAKKKMKVAPHLFFEDSTDNLSGGGEVQFSQIYE